MASFLTALTLREPTVAEIAGGRARDARRDADDRIPCGRPRPLRHGGETDTDVLNISTCGIVLWSPPAAYPSPSTATATCRRALAQADVLEALDVAPSTFHPKPAQTCLDRLGLCFLFAPAYPSGDETRRARAQGTGLPDGFQVFSVLFS